MAPIDPKEILTAFEPVCSPSGGIVKKQEVPKLANLIQRYSKKMVSKCTYINILLATDDSNLEEFLEHRGWETLHEWLDDAVNKNNEPFLFELIQILDKCPVNMKLLKKNDMPKLLKKIMKSSNKDLADKAKSLRQKWIELVDSEQNLNGENGTSSAEKSSKEKRKLKDASKENGQPSSSNKKLKKDENVNGNVINRPTSNSVPAKQSLVQPQVASNNNKTQENGPNRNIKTAKCKLGKSRSIGVLEKDADTKSLPTSSSDSKSSNHHHPTLNNNSFKGSMLLNHTASTPSMPLNKLSKSSNQGIQLIDAQPLPPTELLANTTASHSTKHIIKESAGFMDAISSVPSSTSKLKKKKKISISTSDKPTTVTAIKSPDVDQQSFMDFENDICGDLNNANSQPLNNRSFDENNSMESSSSMNTTSESEFLTFSNASPYDPSRKPSKGILQYVPRGSRGNISWPDDENRLRRVKYFELDGNERCNVAKDPRNFDQCSKSEREKERTQNQKIKNSGVEKKPWSLIPITIDDLEIIGIRNKIGENSEERELQRNRLCNVLPVIDLLERPEDPKEPEENDSNPLANNESVIIPLVDDTNNITDHSDKPYQIDGQPIPFATSDHNNAFYNHVDPQFNLNNNVNQLINDPNLFIPQQQPMYDMYSANGVALQPMQQQMPMDQPPLQPQPQAHWASNWESTINSTNQHRSNHHTPNHQNNYHSKRDKGRERRDDHKKVNCKYFMKNGICRFNDKCKFYHPK